MFYDWVRIRVALYSSTSFRTIDTTGYQIQIPADTIALLIYMLISLLPDSPCDFPVQD